MRFDRIRVGRDHITSINLRATLAVIHKHHQPVAEALTRSAEEGEIPESLARDVITALRQERDRHMETHGVPAPSMDRVTLNIWELCVAGGLSGGSRPDNKGAQLAPKGRARLGVILADMQCVSEAQLAEALDLQCRPDETRMLGQILISREYVHPHHVRVALARQRAAVG